MGQACPCEFSFALRRFGHLSQDLRQSLKEKFMKERLEASKAQVRWLISTGVCSELSSVSAARDTCISDLYSEDLRG